MMFEKIKIYIVPLIVMVAIVLIASSFNTAHAGGRTWTDGCLKAHQYVSGSNYHWAASSRTNSNCSGLSASIWKDSWLTEYGIADTCASPFQVAVDTDPIYAQVSYSGSINKPCSAHTSGGSVLYLTARRFQ